MGARRDKVAECFLYRASWGGAVVAYEHKKSAELLNKIQSQFRAFYFSGCSGRDRTCDQVINSHLLYR